MASTASGLRETVLSDVCDTVGDCGARRFGDGDCWGEGELAMHVSRMSD